MIFYIYLNIYSIPNYILRVVLNSSDIYGSVLRTTPYGVLHTDGGNGSLVNLGTTG